MIELSKEEKKNLPKFIAMCEAIRDFDSEAAEYLMRMKSHYICGNHDELPEGFGIGNDLDSSILYDETPPPFTEDRWMRIITSLRERGLDSIEPPPPDPPSLPPPWRRPPQARSVFNREPIEAIHRHASWCEDPPILVRNMPEMSTEDIAMHLLHGVSAEIIPPVQPSSDED